VNARMRMDSRPATEEEKEELLAFMRNDLADDIDLIMRSLGITWPEFEQLYASRGNVRAITVGEESVAYCWIERRSRELHLHAIFVRPSERGRGIGTEILRGLEDEFREEADVFELGVRMTNRGARSLYERVGFATVSSLDEIGFLLMRKPLGGEPTE